MFDEQSKIDNDVKNERLNTKLEEVNTRDAVKSQQY